MVDSLNHFGVCVSASVTLRKTKMAFFFFFFFQFGGHRREGQIRVFNNELIFIFVLQ